MNDFGPVLAREVWNKGTAIPGVPTDVRREDAWGEYIDYLEYGNPGSDFGWEIDQITSEGGDHISNLQPLNCKNRVAKLSGTLQHLPFTQRRAA